MHALSDRCMRLWEEHNRHLHLPYPRAQHITIMLYSCIGFSFIVHTKRINPFVHFRRGGIDMRCILSFYSPSDLIKLFSPHVHIFAFKQDSSWPSEKIKIGRRCAWRQQERASDDWNCRPFPRRRRRHPLMMLLLLSTHIWLAACRWELSRKCTFRHSSFMNRAWSETKVRECQLRTPLLVLLEMISYPRWYSTSKK